MRSQQSTVHRIIRVLAFGVVAILLVVVALVILGTMMSFLFRALLESGSATESLRQGARTLMTGLGGLGSAIFSLIAALIVILVLMAIGLAILERTPSKQFKARDEAFEALKLRYAKGEITKEQFLEMKKTLEGNASLSS